MEGLLSQPCHPLFRVLAMVLMPQPKRQEPAGQLLCFKHGAIRAIAWLPRAENVQKFRRSFSHEVCIYIYVLTVSRTLGFLHTTYVDCSLRVVLRVQDTWRKDL